MRYLLCMLAISLCAIANAQENIPLTRAMIEDASQGWGRPRIDRSVGNQPISIGGTTFEKGFGTHAASEVEFDLSGGPGWFCAKVGVDDEVTGAASVVFQVIGDRKVLFDSGVMHKGDAAKPVKVDLTGVKRLGLIVTDAGDGV